MKKPEKLNHQFEIADLISKYIEGKTSQNEEGKIKLWISENEAHKVLWEKVTDPDYVERHVSYWKDGNKEYAWKELQKIISGNPSKRVLRFKKVLRYAAIILPLLLALGGGWYLLKSNDKEKLATNQEVQEGGIRIFPKGRVAKLVMGNGTIIQLTDSLTKIIKESKGAKVSNQGSVLRYWSDKGRAKNKVVYNTLATPRGGEYQVVLADGTKVWLNAASSLRYPTAFEGSNREVFLTGEAYFEVAKNVEQPFVVKTEKTAIQVLGTKFNVAAYEEDGEEITTLVEGAVKVASEEGTEGIKLKPGYEALVNTNSNNIKVEKANIKMALAWKNGQFNFDNEELGQILRTLSRWYDVKVVYENGVDTLLHFTGRIRRYEDISGILEKLEMTHKVEFSIKGREVKVGLWKADKTNNTAVK